MEIVDYLELSEVGNSVLTDRVLRALGGTGMLVVRNVPGLERLRSLLLPQARVLALMNDSDRDFILKSNGLGTDVPLKRVDRPVSSFAAQLHFNNTNSILQEDPVNSGQLFRQLGQTLIDVGVKVARFCDLVFSGLELEQSILDSRTAKGRLIHYHSENERHNKKLKRRSSQPGKPAGQTDKETCQPNKFWQQWHYDYGVLTVLTGPMFLQYTVEVAPPDGHSCLVAVDSRTGESSFVNIPPDCLLIQVGEAAQIMSGGRLRATAHCVVNADLNSDISRETFVVFLQPAWDKVLTCSVKGQADLTEVNVDLTETGLDLMIPPLDCRWKDGWTFAEFSKRTTKQYYSSKGLQSNKTRCI